jgi:hypothetical protein
MPEVVNASPWVLARGVNRLEVPTISSGLDVIALE